eukprot:TRINITY_DN3759_c0_g1_i1.p1 TRINITY_DN3759_c0_g1~~TRINITY_DN3759_c0_g1_i1.p1  ORF type:complete len:881 (+),score=202.87 TRINITY_DN3759_c0_g1_i1:282-2645(+)
MAHRIVLQSSIVRPGTKPFTLWTSGKYKKENAQLYKYYLWNITNPAEVIAGGKPDVRQAGPYNFWYYDRAPAPYVHFADDLKSVDFLQRVMYFPKQDLNAKSGTDFYTDKITWANPYYVGAIMKAGSESTLFVALTASTLNTIITTLTGTTFQVSVVGAATTKVLLQTRAALLPAFGEPTFTRIWANVTAPVTGFPAWMHLSNITASNISRSQGVALWNSSSPLSFCNSGSGSGIFLWLAAKTDNNTAAALQSKTGLTMPQVLLVSRWVTSVYSVQGTKAVLTSFGITNLADLGFLQWGQAAVLSGKSTADGTTKSPPEFAIYASRTLNSTARTNLTQSKLLLQGPYALTSAANLGAFLQLVAAKNFAVIQARYAIPASVAVPMASYVQYAGKTFMMPNLNAVFAQGGGLFSTRTAENWLFGKVNGVKTPDPLMTFLNAGVPSYKSLLNNDSTIYDAWVRNSTYRKHTGKDYLSHVGVVQLRNGNEYYQWNGPVKVTGSDGSRYEPFQDPPLEYIQYWNDDLKRPMSFNYSKMVKHQGVKMAEYVLSGEARRKSDRYFNYINGIANSTNLFGTPLFTSMPHLSDGGEMWLCNFTGDMDPTIDTTTTVGVQPYFGLVMNMHQTTQTNLLLDTHLCSKFNQFYSKIQKNSMFPLFWNERIVKMPDATAKSTRNMLHMRDVQLPVLIACLTLGGVMIVVGLSLLYVWRTAPERDYQQSQPEDPEIGVTMEPGASKKEDNAEKGLSKEDSSGSVTGGGSSGGSETEKADKEKRQEGEEGEATASVAEDTKV